MGFGKLWGEQLELPPELGDPQLNQHHHSGVHPVPGQTPPSTHLPPHVSPAATSHPLHGSGNPAHADLQGNISSLHLCTTLTAPQQGPRSPKSPTKQHHAAKAQLYSSLSMWGMQREPPLPQPRANQPRGCPDPAQTPGVLPSCPSTHQLRLTARFMKGCGQMSDRDG